MKKKGKNTERIETLINTNRTSKKRKYKPQRKNNKRENESK